MSRLVSILPVLQVASGGGESEPPLAELPGGNRQANVAQAIPGPMTLGRGDQAAGEEVNGMQ